ncbi:ParA family protein [Sorangium sp. So ce327]|jgi:chromosome partitioning protein|uniref:Chromosome partitioning protein ParA n=1 Tax=Sorangium cellulosum (strain So ce56) TaxID=448385 RepID=A9GYE8_SORC5|nr:ParA family protein [Sorangium cellulosum]CAN97229.1 chromosome partitioning protein ParA [Sorangium cellulosum So ce56]
MHVIAVASQKGGVGKTTISLNLGLALGRAGNRALILELDAQGSLGLSLGLADRARPGVAELLTGAERLESVLLRTREPELQVLTVGRVDPTTVAGFEDALARGPVLPSVLARLSPDFDIVVVDCPAGLGKVTTRALEVATHALLPLQAEPLALRSIGQLLAVIDRVRAEKNPQLSLLGMVLSMFDRQASASLDVAETLWTKFPDGIILDTVIPRDEAFLEASLRGAPLLLMQKRPPPLARVFDQLANDVLVRLDPTSPDDDDGPISLLL